MLRVGLTGGIGSGKSTVSAMLAERGAVVIEYDLLAREVVEPGRPALSRIVETFGEDILTEDGALDRPALGRIVFRDQEALRQLEEITHPAIHDAAADRERSAGKDAIVVHDNPLLVEMGLQEGCDVTIIVDVPEDVQIERIAGSRDITESDARARIANQASRDSRAGVADYVIDNTGSLDALSHLVGGLWEKLVALSG